MRAAGILAFVLAQLLGAGAPQLATAAPLGHISRDAAKGVPAVARASTRHHPRVSVGAAIMLPPRVALAHRGGDYLLLPRTTLARRVLAWRRTGAGPRAPPHR